MLKSHHLTGRAVRIYLVLDRSQVAENDVGISSRVSISSLHGMPDGEKKNTYEEARLAFINQPFG